MNRVTIWSAHEIVTLEVYYTKMKLNKIDTSFPVQVL